MALELIKWENLQTFFSYMFGYTDERDILLEEKKYKGCRWYFYSTQRSIDEMESFDAREDDIFVVTYPKSGTHWMMEVANLVLTDGDPDKINREFEQVPLETVMVEGPISYFMKNFTNTGCKFMSNAPSPRLILSHAPLAFLPQKAWTNKSKIIYVARNFKDVVVSMYNMYEKAIYLVPKENNFHTLLKKALDGEVPYNAWFDHVRDFWEARDRENLLFVTYEEMQRDLRSVVLQVSDFIDHPLSDEAVDKVIQNSEINKMKSNQERNMTITRQNLKFLKMRDFMYKGVSGRWKKYFTMAESEEVDAYLKDKFQEYEELAEKLGFDFKC